MWVLWWIIGGVLAVICECCLVYGGIISREDSFLPDYPEDNEGNI